MRLTKDDIDKVREIEGFPIANDEDIIALSNPPYYTACPNPFIEEFIKKNGTPYNEETDDYHTEPFASDVSEGKNDPIYNAHNYHTKVPYKAIMRYILHYTNPGDIILDGFAGSGMTSVAAKMCGRLDELTKIEMSYDMKSVKWGSRKTILNDLAPIATFISHNYNSNVNVSQYKEQTQKILDDCYLECGWMYKTLHSEKEEQISLISNISNNIGEINYIVWSDVFICPVCGDDIIFSDVAFDKDSGTVNNKFLCKNCGVELNKNSCNRAKKLIYDKKLDKTISISKQVPVLINYNYNGNIFEKAPDEYDIKNIEKIDKIEVPYWYPTFELPKGVNTEQPKKSHGVSNIHLFYTRRNLYVISKIYDLLEKTDSEIKNALYFTFEQVLLGMSKLARYVPTHYSQVNQYLSGTLYIGSQVVEVTPKYILKNKILNLCKVFSMLEGDNTGTIISTGSTTNLGIPNNSVDYIFTDPPFGDNLNYSELSFIWEAWLKVKTNNIEEAIMNAVQKKGLLEYQELMTRCFAEYFRILKPSRWITIEFHNSKNAVWNAIQQSLSRAGFVVADVRTLDKKQGSFKQVVSVNTVKQDLVISAYKPRIDFKHKFLNNVDNADKVWEFINQHLEKLPVVVMKNRIIHVVVERQAFLLYDRMVAYHIVNGLLVPMDAIDFYKKLDEKYLKRDNMYFLSDQVNEYDTSRIINDIEPVQFELFVTNEKSAITWLYQNLNIPQTYAEIQPKFMQEVKTIDKYEAMPELKVILEDNFIYDENGKWYIPDVSKAIDVVKLREKRLWKEFEGYLSTKGKIKIPRSEVIRVGFAKLWADKNYKIIIETAERLPEKVIQEDDKLLMYYDISLGRV